MGNERRFFSEGHLENSRYRIDCTVQKPLFHYSIYTHPKGTLRSWSAGFTAKPSDNDLFTVRNAYYSICACALFIWLYPSRPELALALSLGVITFQLAVMVLTQQWRKNSVRSFGTNLCRCIFSRRENVDPTPARISPAHVL